MRVIPGAHYDFRLNGIDSYEIQKTARFLLPQIARQLGLKGSYRPPEEAGADVFRITTDTTEQDYEFLDTLNRGLLDQFERYPRTVVRRFNPDSFD